MFRSYRDLIRTPVKRKSSAVDSQKKFYFCDLCEQKDDERVVWEFQMDFEIHRRAVHKVELMRLMKEPTKYNMCSVCMRTQPDRATLISHIKNKHLLSPNSSFVKWEIFICDYCNNLFFNKLLLICHIKFYHLNYSKTTKRTACPTCNKYVAVKSLWFHFLYHGIQIGTCPICLKTFDNEQDEFEHIDVHPGYYFCNLCMYQTKTESAFIKHKEMHRNVVSLEGKSDVNAISKFFVPQKMPASWSRKFMNLFRGITLSPEIQICILCRAMCDTDLQMLQHIHGEHSAANVVEIKKHVCACGEDFFNSVLLKHHVFMLKGDHKPAGDTPNPTPKDTQSQQDNEILVPICIPESNTEETHDSIPEKRPKLTDEEGKNDIEKSKTFNTPKEYYEQALTLQCDEGNSENSYEQSNEKTNL